MPSTYPTRAQTRRPALDDADDAFERVVPFRRKREPMAMAREMDEAAKSHRGARRGGDASERFRSAGERRGRRRRQPTNWLHRNALSLAAIGALVVLAIAGFALLQLLTRGDPAATTPAPAATSAAAEAPVAVSSAPAAAPATAGPAVREIQASTRVLEANYTVQAGDTASSIATRFNTTVQRIQALNNLGDPKLLNIGQKLVIPPPL